MEYEAVDICFTSRIIVLQRNWIQQSLTLVSKSAACDLISLFCDYCSDNNVVVFNVKLRKFQVLAQDATMFCI